MNAAGKEYRNPKRYIVRRLKVLCPTKGKKRIAQTLARAGIVLGVSTVKRILKEPDGQDSGRGQSRTRESAGE